MQSTTYAIGETIDLPINTFNGATGLPATPTGPLAVSLFRGGSTTALTAGVALFIDEGGAGVHRVRILTSDASFVPGVDYTVRITAGATDVSLVGTVVAAFRLSRVTVSSDWNTAKRMLDGRSNVGGIGDSITSSSATWRCVTDWDIDYSGPRMRMRGEVVLMDGQNPFSQKGAAAQTGIRVDVAKEATFPTTSIVNRLPFVAASSWVGSLANFLTFTPGGFGSGATGSAGLYLNPNNLPYDIGAIDTWLSYIGGSHNVTSMRQTTRRDVSVGAAASAAFNPTSVSGYTSNHYTVSTMAGTGGAIDCVAQLQVAMTDKAWLQLGYGWVAKDRTQGMVYCPIIGVGGTAVADFATEAGGENPANAIKDDQIDAWFEAIAASGYPMDTLRIHLGVNEVEFTPRTALYLQMLDRWVTIGQRHTKERFGVLCYTPTPYIGVGVDRTPATEFQRDEIARAVEEFGEPDRVQLVDMHWAMRDLYGSVTDWGPAYLEQTGSTYLHTAAAGGAAFGAAQYRALENAAADTIPATKEAVTRLSLPTQTADATEARLIDDEDGQALLHNIYQTIAESLIESDPAAQGIAAAVVEQMNADATQQTLQTRVAQAHAAITDGTAGVAAQYLTLLALGEGQTELGEALANVVDVEALATAVAPYLLPTDVEGAHVPDSRTAKLIRRGDKLYSETPLPISAGESGPLFAASFAKDLAGGGSIYQVVSITVVSKPDDAGDEDLVVVGDFKRNGAEARFALAAAAEAAVGRYVLQINVIYAGGGGPALALVDVNVGASS